MFYIKKFPGSNLHSNLGFKLRVSFDFFSFSISMEGYFLNICHIFFKSPLIISLDDIQPMQLKSVVKQSITQSGSYPCGLFQFVINEHQVRGSMQNLI